MPDALSSIGSFFSSTGGKAALTGGTAVTGLLQNLFANREAARKQKFVEDLITNPTKFNAYVSGFEKPLAAGLTSDIARQTDAYGAERGLGSSPAVMKDVYAQALAPYFLQQQDSARQAALQSLGIYEQSPTTKPIDVSSIFKALAMMGTPPPANQPDQALLNIMRPGYGPGGGPVSPPPFDPGGTGILPNPSVDISGGGDVFSGAGGG